MHVWQSIAMIVTRQYPINKRGKPYRLLEQFFFYEIRKNDNYEMTWATLLVYTLNILWLDLSCTRRISTFLYMKHNNFIEIKQMSNVNIKQNNVSTSILLIKILVY